MSLHSDPSRKRERPSKNHSDRRGPSRPLGRKDSAEIGPEGVTALVEVFDMLNRWFEERHHASGGRLRLNDARPAWWDDDNNRAMLILPSERPQAASMACRSKPKSTTNGSTRSALG